MPKWIHDRAHHIMSKNPDMKKSTAFAVATQQGEAQGKDPAGFGTAEGHREAKRKYRHPSQYEERADPGGAGKRKESALSLSAAGMHGFSDEIVKIAKGNDRHEAGKRGARYGAARGAGAGIAFGAALGPGIRLGQQAAKHGRPDRLVGAAKRHPGMLLKALRGAALKGAAGGALTGAGLGAAKGYMKGRELHHIVVGDKGKKKESAAPSTVGTVAKSTPKPPSLKQASYSKPRQELPEMRPGMSNTLPPPIATAAGN